MGPTVRLASAADAGILRRAVYQAWRWRDPWSEAAFAEHSRLREPDAYVDDFGRRDGDVGVVAERMDEQPAILCGAAWFRSFTAEDHREGFVNAATPEVVIAVFDGLRGEGIGRRLMEELMAAARRRDLHRLSLHVHRENERAIRLYRSQGFRPVAVDHRRQDEKGLVMVADLASSRGPAEPSPSGPSSRTAPS